MIISGYLVTIVHAKEGELLCFQCIRLRVASSMGGETGEPGAETPHLGFICFAGPASVVSVDSITFIIRGVTVAVIRSFVYLGARVFYQIKWIWIQ